MRLADLKYLFKPSMWNMLYTYSPSWDAFILKAISNGDVWRGGPHIALVGGRDVWVANYPYAFGKPEPGCVRPSRRTIELLRDALAVAPHISERKDRIRAAK